MAKTGLKLSKRTGLGLKAKKKKTLMFTKSRPIKMARVISASSLARSTHRAPMRDSRK